MAETKLFKNTVYYSIGEILPRVISFLLLPIYTRYLSPADYGIISYTSTIIIFLYVLGAFSLNSYVLRFYFIHTEEKEKRSIIGTAQLAILGLNTIILALAFVIMPCIIENYQIQVPWNPYFRYAFIINFLDCLSIIPMVIYRVRQDAVKFVMLGFIRTLLTVFLTIYLVVFLKQGVIGTFQANLYVLIPYSIIYLYVIQKYGRWEINWKYLRESLAFCAPLIPGAICYQLLSVSDRVILERNVGIDSLGIYNIACQMALVLNIIIQSGYKAIEPELFCRFGNDGFYTFIRRVQSLFFFSIYVGALGICMFSQEVFYIMTSEAFHKGYLLVPALMVGVVMTGQNVIYSGILQGERRTKVIGSATVVGAIVSISINIILIPYFGTYAAALASAVSYIVMNTVLFVSMTYPGKSIWRESLLVLTIPIITYISFGLFKDISIYSIIIKMMIIILYGYIALYLLNIDINDIGFVSAKQI